MTDDKTTTAGGDASAATSGTQDAGTAASTTAGATGAADTASGQDSWSQETAAKEISKLRSEAASRRTEEQDLKKKLKVYQDQEAETERKKLEAKGEYQKVIEQQETKVKAIKERVIMAELKVAAQAAGIIEPMAVELIKMNKALMDQVGFDEETGEIKGVAEAIAAFKVSAPKLFAAPAATTAAADAGATTADVTTTGTTKADPTPGTQGAFDAMSLSETDWQARRHQMIHGS